VDFLGFLNGLLWFFCSFNDNTQVVCELLIILAFVSVPKTVSDAFNVCQILVNILEAEYTSSLPKLQIFLFFFSASSFSWTK